MKAVGSYHDLIATYEFKVAFTASYVVWKQTFATSNQTNDISFKIDDGDWYMWRPPHKGSHALWTEYYYQVQWKFLCLMGHFCDTDRKISIVYNNSCFDKGCSKKVHVNAYAAMPKGSLGNTQ